MLEDFWYARVAPDRGYGLPYPDVEGLFGIWVDGVVDEVVAVFVVAGRLGLYLELPHGADERLCAIDDVLIDGEAVHGELLLRVAILVDDLHLLDDGRLAALSGACRMLASVRGGCRVGVGSSPSSRILHSRRNRRESSSSLRSMAWLRFFCSTSSLLVLMQMPILVDCGSRPRDVLEGRQQGRAETMWQGVDQRVATGYGAGGERGGREGT